MESGSDDPFFRQFRERRLEREQRFGAWFALDNLEDAQLTWRGERPGRVGFRLFVGFIWCWCSWMSFGVWAFVFGNPVSAPGDAGPWTLTVYLGIPVAPALGGLVTFVLVRGVPIPWRRK